MDGTPPTQPYTATTTSDLVESSGSILPIEPGQSGLEEEQNGETGPAQRKRTRSEATLGDAEDVMRTKMPRLEAFIVERCRAVNVRLLEEMRVAYAAIMAEAFLTVMNE